ncbi:MAG: helix-turn-helix transcriptional regulator [Bacilli bacterium]|nr:helix-turn-helix transcriptional regulator [Bacilli bacterium]
MDTIKIGSFIMELRKKKNMTQKELADKLGITDRAISKWENGRGLPDHSLILDLANILGVSVNELLTGSYLDSKEYKEASEDNLLTLAASSEYFNKELNILEKTFCIIQFIAIGIMIFIFILNMFFNYIYRDGYDGYLFKYITPFLIITSFSDLLYMAVLRFREQYKIIKRKEK